MKLKGMFEVGGIGKAIEQNKINKFTVLFVISLPSMFLEGRII